MSVGRIRRNHKKTKRKQPNYSSDEDENDKESVACKKRKVQSQTVRKQENVWGIFQLICDGYCRNNHNTDNIPKGIVQQICHFYANVKLFKAYDSFNNFKFQERDGKIAENFKYIQQQLVYPLPLIYKKHLLKLEEFKQDTKMYGKYTRVNSHKIDLSENSEERIYHLLDSFVINKFSDLFTQSTRSNYNSNSIDEINGDNRQGPYGGGFKAMGGADTLITDNDVTDEMENYGKCWEELDVWKFDEDDNRVDFFQQMFQGILVGRTQNDTQNENMNKDESDEDNGIDGSNGNKDLSQSNVYKHLMNKIVLDHTKGMYDFNSLCIAFGNGLDTYITQKNEFGKIFLSLFDGVDGDCIKAYTATNIAYDTFGENGLNEDRLLCVMDDDKIVAVWTMRYRLYG